MILLLIDKLIIFTLKQINSAINNSEFGINFWENTVLSIESSSLLEETRKNQNQNESSLYGKSYFLF